MSDALEKLKVEEAALRQEIQELERAMPASQVLDLSQLNQLSQLNLIHTHIPNNVVLLPFLTRDSTTPPVCPLSAQSTLSMSRDFLLSCFINHVFFISSFHSTHFLSPSSLISTRPLIT